MNAVLRVRGLRVEFPTHDGVVKAVDGLDLDLFHDEVLGIVGESGSGKTVTALAILGLLPASARVAGSVLYRGRELLGCARDELRELRGSRLAMVFQEALGALNPAQRVGRQVAEAVAAHRPATAPAAVNDKVLELLDLVGIPNPSRRAEDYPHQFSGGMRQRVLIAIAIANDPEVLIADEPTTALDVTVQAQVLDVLGRIRDRTGASMILITHDLGVVAGIADRVLVMYAGRSAEVGAVEAIYGRSRHPYTLGLLASVPSVDVPVVSRLHSIRGQPPSLITPPSGCAFHPRCDHARLPDPCATTTPALRAVGDGHASACHFAEELGS